MANCILSVNAQLANTPVNIHFCQVLFKLRHASVTRPASSATDRPICASEVERAHVRIIMKTSSLRFRRFSTRPERWHSRLRSSVNLPCANVIELPVGCSSSALYCESLPSVQTSFWTLSSDYDHPMFPSTIPQHRVPAALRLLAKD